MHIAVIGAGKLGSVMACLHAEHNYVHVYDVSEAAREALRTGEGLPPEPGLRELWQRSRERITVYDDPLGAPRAAQMVFCVAPTPSLLWGSFDQRHVLAALAPTAKTIAQSEDHKLVVVVSTVDPESCGREIIPTLSRLSGKQVGEGWDLCYSPEFIVLGDIVRGMSHPDFVLIGERSTAGETLAWYYSDFYTKYRCKPRIVRLPLIDAEIAKLALNCALTVKIGYANAVAALCDRVPGADAKNVLSAVGEDPRIGGRLLSPGPPPGGPCLPRDVRALAAFAHRLHVPCPIPTAVALAGSQWHDAIVTKIPRTVGSVAVLGLTYKPGTPMTEESAGVELVARLRRRHSMVLTHDPWIEGSDAVRDCLACGAAIVAVPHPEYSEICDHPEWLRPELILIDAWGALDTPQVRGACRYYKWGRCD